MIQQFRATQAYRRRGDETQRRWREFAQRLPPVNDVALAPVEPPQEAYPDTSVPPSGDVVQASYTAPARAIGGSD